MARGHRRRARNRSRRNTNTNLGSDIAHQVISQHTEHVDNVPPIISTVPKVHNNQSHIDSQVENVQDTDDFEQQEQQKQQKQEEYPQESYSNTGVSEDLEQVNDQVVSEEDLEQVNDQVDNSDNQVNDDLISSSPRGTSSQYDPNNYEEIVKNPTDLKTICTIYFDQIYLKTGSIQIFKCSLNSGDGGDGGDGGGGDGGDGGVDPKFIDCAVVIRDYNELEWAKSEFAALSLFNHPNLPKVYHFNEDACYVGNVCAQGIFTFKTLALGTSLLGQSFSEASCKVIICQVCAAVSHYNDLGIAHLCLCSSNVFFDDESLNILVDGFDQSQIGISHYEKTIDSHQISAILEEIFTGEISDGCRNFITDIKNFEKSITAAESLNHEWFLN